MTNKNIRVWMFLTAILLLVLAFAGYFYWAKGKQVVAPADLTTITEEPEEGTVPPEESVEEVEELRTGYVDMGVLRSSHPKVQLLDQLEDQIRGYLQQQGKQREELAISREQVESQYADLSSQLDSQVQSIQDKYQKLIDAKVEELQKELTRYEETRWNEAMAQIQRKKDDMQVMGEGLINRYGEQQMQKMSEEEAAINAEYTPKIMNIQLKLGMIQLSEAEQKKYRDELEQLGVEKAKKLEEARVKLEEEANQYIETKQAELDQELQAYQNQLKVEVENALLAKQTELDQKLQAYIKEMETAMQNEITGKQNRLDEQTRSGLQRAQTEIDRELEKNDNLLTGKIEEARKKQEEILNQIDEEIKAIIAEVAEKEQIDLVLTDLQVNVDALDLTDKVLKKLNQ